MVRLMHVLSHDVGIPASMPYCLPLAARGWNVGFVCPIGPGSAVATRHGMRVRPLALRRTFDARSDLAGAAQLVRYFREDRPDIVHTHNIKVGHMARVLAYLTRVPIVVHTLHGLAYSLETPALKRHAHTALEWLASRRVDVVLAQSDEDRHTVIESGAIDARRVEWIGNGIDLARFSPSDWPDEARRRARAEIGITDDEILFLSAGRIVREKGFIELFEAAARARTRDPRIRLAVAGEVDEEKADALDPRVLDGARAAGVRLLGRRADMPKLYAAADVVTLISWREGLPRALMEGAAMGKPLLAADARGCREVVRPPHNGLLVPIRDPDALAEAMLTMASDSQRRAAWGDANAREARERYDLEAVVARVVAVYDRLLAARGTE